jgi:hypothetical protein
MMGYREKKHGVTTQKPAMLTHSHEHMPKIHVLDDLHLDSKHHNGTSAKSCSNKLIQWTYVNGSSTQIYGPNVASA